MKRTIVVGGGFAGVSALRALKHFNKHNETILIDKKDTFDFLPSLPDCIGERIELKSLKYPLEAIAKQYHASFVRAEAIRFNADSRSLSAQEKIFSWDYLVLACAAYLDGRGKNA